MKHLKFVRHPARHPAAGTSDFQFNLSLKSLAEVFIEDLQLIWGKIRDKKARDKRLHCSS